MCPPPRQRHVLRLPDDDALMVYENTPPRWQPGQPMALLVHGLTGSHASTHIVRVAARLLARGVRVVRLDLRGTGLGLPLARKTYHAGRSEDVRAVLELMHRWSPTSPLLLFGISLGGNMVLKLAGEAADRPVPGLVRVATIAPPIDLVRCAVLLELPRCRMYEQNFVKDLLRDVRRRHRIFPDLPTVQFPRQIRMRDFDELYTAPRCGFADAMDYYQQSSSMAFIPRIALPTLILTSRDDPFIAPEPFEELRVPDHIQIRILPWGGHVGFIGWDGQGGIRWAEQRVVDWLVRV